MFIILLLLNVYLFVLFIIILLNVYLFVCLLGWCFNCIRFVWCFVFFLKNKQSILFFFFFRKTFEIYKIRWNNDNVVWCTLFIIGNGCFFSLCWIIVNNYKLFFNVPFLKSFLFFRLKFIDIVIFLELQYLYSHQDGQNQAVCFILFTFRNMIIWNKLNLFFCQKNSCCGWYCRSNALRRRLSFWFWSCVER